MHNSEVDPLDWSQKAKNFGNHIDSLKKWKDL